MYRRDFIKKSLMVIGFASPSVQMIFALTSQNSTEKSSGKFPNSDEPTDLAIVPIQIMLSDLLPQKNFIENDDYFGLLTELLYLRIRKQSQLKKIIIEEIEFVLRLDKEVVESKIRNRDYGGVNPDRLLKTGVFLSHVGLVRSALIKRFPNGYRGFKLV
jgi:hypothetical protein